MKWKKILVLLLIVILSTALMSPGISAEEETTSQESCRYYYQLERTKAHFYCMLPAASRNGKRCTQGASLWRCRSGSAVEKVQAC